MNTMVRRTLSVHKEHEVLLKLEAAGLDDELAQKVINSKGNSLATEVVRLIENDTPISQQTRVRQIMGRNFFGVREAIKYFGIKPNMAEVNALVEIPFSEEVLESCKDTHILVAVFPLSILDIRSRVGSEFLDPLSDQSWYNKEAFAEEKGEVGWHLVRKITVPDSVGKTWKKQQALLGENEEVPSAQVMVYTIIGHYLATGERLFENVYVRTSSVDSDGDRVRVGRFDDEDDGLKISCYLDDERAVFRSIDWMDKDFQRGSIGVALARKP